MKEKQPGEQFEVKPLIQLPYRRGLLTTIDLPAQGQGIDTHMRAMDASRRSVQTGRREITGKDVLHYFKARRVPIFITLAIVQLALFAGLVYVVKHRPHWYIDVAVTNQLQNYHWLRDLMYLASIPGNVPHLLTAISLLTAITFWLARQRLAALLLLAVVGLTDVLNDTLKTLVHRPRPSAGPRVSVLSSAQGTSFPSGHVMAYIALWGLLFLFMWLVFKGNGRKSWWWRWPVLLLCGLLVILIGPSRVYLGDHWATDAIGGYLCEGVVLCLVMALYFKTKQVTPKAKRWVVRRTQWRWLNRILFHQKMTSS